jgi:hypothetical protein
MRALIYFLKEGENIKSGLFIESYNVHYFTAPIGTVKAAATHCVVA